MSNYEKFLYRPVDTSHVELIMDVKDRQARRIMERIRERAEKEPHQLIFLKEVLDYTGLPVQYAVMKLGWERFGGDGSDSGGRQAA